MYFIHRLVRKAWRAFLSSDEILLTILLAVNFAALVLTATQLFGMDGTSGWGITLLVPSVAAALTQIHWLRKRFLDREEDRTDYWFKDAASWKILVGGTVLGVVVAITYEAIDPDEDASNSYLNYPTSENQQSPVPSQNEEWIDFSVNSGSADALAEERKNRSAIGGAVADLLRQRAVSRENGIASQPVTTSDLQQAIDARRAKQTSDDDDTVEAEAQ
jgi:hypothetical protein